MMRIKSLHILLNPLVTFPVDDDFQKLKIDKLSVIKFPLTPLNYCCIGYLVQFVFDNTQDFYVILKMCFIVHTNQTLPQDI